MLVALHVQLVIIVLLEPQVFHHINTFARWVIIVRRVRHLCNVLLEHMVHFMDLFLMHNANHVNQVNIVKLVQHMVNHVHPVTFVQNRDKDYQHHVRQAHITVEVALETLQNAVLVLPATFVAMAEVLMASNQIGHKTEHA